MKPVSIDDYRAVARSRLPRFLFDYLDGGAQSETTMLRNRSDLDGIALRQRVMRDVSTIDTSVEILGRRWALPIVLAPVGLAGLYSRRGECQAVRAAADADIPFCLSTVSGCSIEEVADATDHPFWFQLYMIRDRGFMRELLQRARSRGCSALLFTVDMPVPGMRYRDYRSGLAGAPGLGGAIRRTAQAMTRPRWAYDVGLRGRPHHLGNVAPILNGRTGIEDFFAWMRGNFDPSVTWRDLDFIRQEWDGRLAIKGLLDVDDARHAARIGADGIVISNHGGRQLDGAPSTCSMLPAIAEACGDRIEILVDGGVRSGTDIVRMLALGARAVLIGRPWVYALAAGGQNAVTAMLDQLAAELRTTMALTGVSNIHAIGPEQIATRSGI